MRSTSFFHSISSGKLRSLFIILGFMLGFAGTVFSQNLQPADADVYSPSRKNFLYIQRHHINIRMDSIRVGSQLFYINILTKKGHKHQKYMVIHDSEDAAFDAGLRAIKHGGTLIALENHEQRALYSFGKIRGSSGQDPNRMFQLQNPYWPVAQRILHLLDASSKNLIIVLHNNTPEGNFRIDTIATWKNISVPAAVDKDPKSMVWIPGKTPAPDLQTRAEIKYYARHKMNVVYEYVPINQTGDGSLSVYSTKHGIPYRNIEVKAGIRGNRKSENKARSRQIRYLKHLRKYHGLK